VNSGNEEGSAWRGDLGATGRYERLGESNVQLRKWRAEADTNVTDLIAGGGIKN
jgi:hypothetical protein